MAKEAGSKSGKTPSGSPEPNGGRAPAALPAVRVASSLFRPQTKPPMAPKAPTAPKAPATASNAPPPIAPRVSMPSIPPPLPPAAMQGNAPSSVRPPMHSKPPLPPLPPLAPVASEPIQSIPPPPPSSAPRSSRDPQNPLAVMSLASIRVAGSHSSTPPAPPSQPRVAPSLPPPMHQPMYQAPLSTTARMPMPSTPAAFTTTPSDSPHVIPTAAPSAPPSSPASVRYERAFRSWSYSSPPPSEIDGADPESSQGPLTYAVYTAQDMPPVSRASRAFITQPPPPPTMRQRFGMIAIAASIVLCTAAAIVLGVVDDGPKAPRAPATASFAPPAAIDPSPVADPASMTTTTSFIPPVVTIVDDPNAQPAPAPVKKKKKIVANGDSPVINASTKIDTNAPAPPPNPYAVVSKK